MNAVNEGFLLALILINIPKVILLIKLWLQKFRMIIGDLNPRTSDLETIRLPPHHQAVFDNFMTIRANKKLHSHHNSLYLSKI